MLDALIAIQRVEFSHNYSLCTKYNLHKDPLYFVSFTLCFLILLFSYVYAVIESSPYLWDSIWNVIVSITTIGYGDVVPVTDSGRILIVVASNFGVIFLSFITSII